MALRFLIIISMLFAFIGFEAYITAWPVVSQFVPEDSMDLVNKLIMVRFFYFIFPILFVITAFTIIITHRIAGPIFRLERTLDRLIQGEDVEPMQLRRGDELKGLVAKINDLILLVRESRRSNGKETQSSNLTQHPKIEPLGGMASSGSANY
jgi:signal transduction histidine kinase